MLPVIPLNWDEIIGENDAVANWENSGEPSGGKSPCGDGDDNDNGEGEEDPQGSEKGPGKGKGTKDRKGKGKGMGNGNCGGKGIA